MSYYQEPKLEHGKCNCTWGHCTPIAGLNFGRASATPHICNGSTKHIAKLHRCGTCGSMGHRITPTKLTKAGRQVSAILALQERIKAETPTTPEDGAPTSF